MSENEMERVEPRAMMRCDVPVDLDQMMRLAQVISQSGILPNHLRGKPSNVLAIMFAAKNLDMPLWSAMQELHEVDGKIGLSANMMRALWLRAGHSFRVIERSELAATVEVTRRGEDPYRVTWTLEDAERAGLCQIKDGRAFARSQIGKRLPWEAYTSAMLIARATSAALREVGADILLGFGYTPDELSSGDYDEESGTVHVVTSLPAQPAEAEKPRIEQDAWDAALAEIASAESDAALQDLWRRFNEERLVRVPFDGAEGRTLEDVILARHDELSPADA